MCDFPVVPIRDDTVLNGILQLDYTSRFEADGAALSTLPPTILIITGNRSGGAESHPETRVIPSDHSHAFPVFEEFLQTPQPQGSQRLKQGARGIWLQPFVHIAGGSEHLAFRGHLLCQLPDAL